MTVDLAVLEAICRHNSMSYSLDFDESTWLYSASTSSASPDDSFEIKKMSSPQAKDIAESYEYLCHDCGQLRLYLDTDKEKKICGNCGSVDIVCGPPGSLKKP